MCLGLWKQVTRKKSLTHDTLPATLFATVVDGACEEVSEAATADAIAPIALIGASDESVIDEGVELAADPGAELGGIWPIIPGGPLVFGPPMELGMEFICGAIWLPGGIFPPGPMELWGGPLPGMEFGMELGTEE